MGLLDLFGGAKGALKKHAGRAANKRAQAPDRWDSLRALADMKNREAAEALLERFTFRVDPSITDQEEKDLAFEGIVAVGEDAVGPVVAFLRRADSATWPVKLLERLVPEERVVGELLEVLAKMDTEYERDPERKIQVVSYLSERSDPRIAPAVERFLDDLDETVRFHAVECVFNQAEESASDARPSLVGLLEREESLRVRAKVFEGWLAQGWAFEPDEAATLRERLPPGWAIDPKGLPRKR